MSNDLINAIQEFAPHVADLAKLDPAQEPELLRVLTREAERFARAGGRWSASEWAGLCELERVAAEAAGERVWRTRTAEVVDAVGAPEGAAAMRAAIDGGASLEDLAMDRVAAAAMRKAAARGETPVQALSVEPEVAIEELFR